MLLISFLLFTSFIIYSILSANVIVNSIAEHLASPSNVFLMKIIQLTKVFYMQNTAQLLTHSFMLHFLCVFHSFCHLYLLPCCYCFSIGCVALAVVWVRICTKSCAKFCFSRVNFRGFFTVQRRTVRLTTNPLHASPQKRNFRMLRNVQICYNSTKLQLQ